MDLKLQNQGRIPSENFEMVVNFVILGLARFQKLHSL